MRSACRRIANLRVRHAASHRFVMLGADELGFDPASEPIRASLVRFFKPAAGAEIDNAVTLVSTASTRPCSPTISPAS
jgi:hypothetical protein